ncbi:HNH endonuclease [Amycolatopsis japonica]|uniref:HNH endonuclease n=1 Tax=Amycolatopsis japonica TaxID=208439 RepID=UPI0037885965
MYEASGSRRKRRLPEHVRKAVLQRDNYRCQLRLDDDKCEVRANQVDHIVPEARGGSDALTNLQAACAFCNNSKNAGQRFDPQPVIRRQWW